MITSTQIKTDQWQVKLDSGRGARVVGHIQRTKAGYQYFPKGKKEGGDIYDSLDECQQSLEGE